MYAESINSAVLHQPHSRMGIVQLRSGIHIDVSGKLCYFSLSRMSLIAAEIYSETSLWQFLHFSQKSVQLLSDKTYRRFGKALLLLILRDGKALLLHKFSPKRRRDHFRRILYITRW
jgi:hypothetical protein